MFTLLNFGGSFPGKIDNIKKRWNQTDVKVSHASANVGLAVSDSLYHNIREMHGLEKSRVFIGRTKTGAFAAEHTKENGEKSVAIFENGKIKAALYNDDGSISPYSDQTHRGTVVLFALLPHILKETEASTAFTEIKKYIFLDSNADDWDFDTVKDNFSKNLCVLSNIIYYRNKNGDFSGTLKLRQTDLKQQIIEVLYGTPEIFEVQKKEASVVPGKYKFDKRTLSADEKKLVPIMPQSYSLPKWVDTMAKEIMVSEMFAEPFRNFLLSGPAGTGKTTGARAIASLLGLPYVKFTCDPDMDLITLIGQMLPNTSYETNCGVTFDDIENSFEQSYEILFGKKPDKYAAPTDCYKKLFETKGNDFTFVESTIIQAARNGWVCEIQEPSVIKRPAVLVGLNALLEATSDYTLPTGEVIKRHPSCIFILTTNPDYVGCSSLQQSVLSRMNMVKDVTNPISEMKERVIKNTNFPKDVDSELALSKMVNTVVALSEYCKERDITDGVCGFRELCDWAKLAMVYAKIENTPITDAIMCKTALCTILKKAAPQSDDFEDILTCFARQYSLDDINSAKAEIESEFL